MSHSIKAAVAIAALTVLGACADRTPEETVVVQPTPVVSEPVTGKF
jgi:hypothetical protein